MYFKVSGVTFDDRQETIKNNVRVRDKVVLIKELNNKFDQFALKIETLSGKQIGYVPKEISQSVYQSSAFSKIEAEIVAIRGFSENQNYGLVIFLDNTNELSKPKNYNGRIIRFKQYKFKMIESKFKEEPSSWNGFNPEDPVSLIGFSRGPLKSVSWINSPLEVHNYFKNFWKNIFYSNWFSMKVINDRAFKDNNMIEELRIDGALHTVGENAFNGCSNLKSVNLWVHKLEESVFENCEKIETVEIDTNYIGKQAFKNCKKLKKINFNKRTQIKIDFIGESAFEGCENLEAINLSNSSIVSIIPKRCFANCYKLKEIYLPDSINFIDSQAFENCYELEKIIIDGEVFSVEKEAFSNCKKLRSIHFNGSVKSLHLKSFKNCESLEEVFFNRYLFEINNDSFLGCEKLKKIHINADKTWIEKNLSYPKNFKIEILSSRLTRKREIDIFDMMDKLGFMYDYGGDDND
jgi:hypothetical protein